MKLTNQKYRKVPLQMVQLALTERAMFNPIRLFLLLSFYTPGQVVLDSEKRQFLKRKLGVTDRTLRSLFHELVKINWLGYNRKKYYIRSLDSIRIIENWHNTKAIFLFFSWLQSTNRFKGFVYAGLASELIRKQIKKGGSSGYHLEAFQARPTNFYPISNIAFSKLQRISKTKAILWKKIAASESLVLVKKNQSVIKFETKQMAKKHLMHCKMHNPVLGNKMTIKDNCIMISKPDLIKSEIPIKSRVKIRK